MKRFGIRVFAAVQVICACLVAPASVSADQADPRLAALFQRLHDAQPPAVAQAIEYQIWAIWNLSGDPALDSQLRQGDDAMARADFDKARAIYDAAILVRPDFAEAWNKRATMFYLAGNMTASLSDIEHVLELEPRHFGALSGLGLVNLALSREAAAIDAFERVLSLYPANQAAHDNIEAIRKRQQESDI